MKFWWEIFVSVLELASDALDLSSSIIDLSSSLKVTAQMCYNCTGSGCGDTFTTTGANQVFCNFTDGYSCLVY